MKSRSNRAAPVVVPWSARLPLWSGRISAVVARQLVFGLSLVWSVSAVVQADEQPGERAYQKLCASCHGTQGEGVADQFAKPLIGDWTVAELAKVIAGALHGGRG